MKILLVLNILVSLLLFENSFLFAQIKYEYFGVEKGLSQSNARAIVQDKEGFLWIGTWDGLNRYDGYSFKHYQYNPAEKNSISANNIINLAVDKNDNIWISYVDGRIDFFNKKKEEFIPIEYNNNLLMTSAYQSVVEDIKGNLWVVAENKVLKIESNSLKITEYKSFRDFSKAKINFNNYIALFDSNRIYIVAENDEIFYFENNFEIVYIYKNSKDKFFFASDNGMLFEFNIYTKEKTLIKDFRFVKNENVIIYSILEDSQNRLWVGGSSGLYFSNNYYSNKEKIQFDKVNFNFENKQNFGNEVFFSLFEDNSGIIWAGHWTGVFKIPPQRKNFKSIPLRKKYSEVFGNNFPICFYSENDSLLLLGTTDGLFIYNIFNNKIEKFTGKNSQLSSSAVYVIFKDSKERIWVGTKNGLNLFDLNKKIFNPFLFKSNLISEAHVNTIYSITESTKGELLIGTVNGLIIFNPESKKYTQHTFKSNIKSESESFILSLFVDNNFLWAGTNGEGLLKINLNDMSFKRFVVEEGNINSLSHNKVMGLYKDKENRMWIATLGGGINLLESDEKTFRHFNINNGLPNNSIYGFVEDDNNNLWISSNNGISKINNNNFEIINYSTDDGLTNIEFNQNAYYKNKNGNLFFGGVSGIVFFNPDEIKINETKPNVVITDFKLFNKSRHDLLNKSQISLNYDENFFSFEIAALIFDNPSKNQYAYKLEGLSDKWIYLLNRRTIDFSGINPGNYILKVKAANEDGLWSDEKTLANINIKPPFWQTLWFRILIVFVLVSVLLLIIIIIVRKNYNKKLAELEKENLLISERIKTRDKIARDLHDDLASTVGSAGLYLETAMRIYDKEPDNVKKYLEKTTSILNEAKQSMSDIIWAVSPKHDTLNNLLVRMKIFANEVFETSGIKIEFISKGDYNIKISEDIRRNFYLIFKESIFNIIKHSFATETKIIFILKNNLLTLELIDNGKGFLLQTEEQKLGGNGLKNIRKRAEEINADINIISELNKGTKIILKKEITP